MRPSRRDRSCSCSARARPGRVGPTLPTGPPCSSGPPSAGCSSPPGCRTAGAAPRGGAASASAPTGHHGRVLERVGIARHGVGPGPGVDVGRAGRGMVRRVDEALLPLLGSHGIVEDVLEAALGGRRGGGGDAGCRRGRRRGGVRRVQGKEGPLEAVGLLLVGGRDVRHGGRLGWSYGDGAKEASGGRCRSRGGAAKEASGGRCRSRGAAKEASGGRCRSRGGAAKEASGGRCRSRGGAAKEASGGRCRSRGGAAKEASGGRCRSRGGAAKEASGGRRRGPWRASLAAEGSRPRRGLHLPPALPAPAAGAPNPKVGAGTAAPGRGGVPAAGFVVAKVDTVGWRPTSPWCDVATVSARV